MFFLHQISQRVFELARNESSPDVLLPEGIVLSGLDAAKEKFEIEDDHYADAQADVPNRSLSRKYDRSKSALFELYKRRTTVVVRRETFLDIVCEALAEYKYVGPNHRADLVLACRYDFSLYLSAGNSLICSKKPK